MPQKPFAILGVAAVLLASRAPLLAQLVGPEDVHAAPDNVTYDPTSGLDWLNLTQTENMSYNDALAATQPGGEFAGFTVATDAQVSALFYSYGLVPSVFTGADPATLSKVAAFTTAFGQTSTQNGYEETFGITATAGGAGTRVVDGLDFYYSSGQPGYAVSSTGVAYGDANASPSVGVWLVTPAPEPGTWAILGAGALLLFGVSRRQRRRSA